MKRRNIEPRTSQTSAEKALCRALLSLNNVRDMHAFLKDLCTPSELEALADRWRVVPLVLRDLPYRDIHERTGVSITTIARVARFIKEGNGGYLAAIAAREEHTTADLDRPPS